MLNEQNIILVVNKKMHSADMYLLNHFFVSIILVTASVINYNILCF